MRKGAQIYTVREFIKTKEGYEDSLRKIKAMGYDSVQTYSTLYTNQEHRALLDQVGLMSESAGGDYLALRDDAAARKAAIEQAQVMGTNLIGVGTLPTDMRDSYKGFKAYAEGINKIAAELTREGMRLLYHSHALEFFSFGGGRNGMDILVDETDPEGFCFCMDTHWMQSGGVNPSDYLRRVSGRLPILHCKDYKIIGGATLVEDVVKTFAEVGEGNLDWPKILAAAKDAGAKSLVVEQDICPGDPFESLAISYRNLAAFTA